MFLGRRLLIHFSQNNSFLFQQQGKLMGESGRILSGRSYSKAANWTQSEFYQKYFVGQDKGIDEDDDEEYEVEVEAEVEVEQEVEEGEEQGGKEEGGDGDDNEEEFEIDEDEEFEIENAVDEAVDEAIEKADGPTEEELERLEKIVVAYRNRPLRDMAERIKEDNLIGSHFKRCESGGGFGLQAVSTYTSFAQWTNRLCPRIPPPYSFTEFEKVLAEAGCHPDSFFVAPPPQVQIHLKPFLQKAYYDNPKLAIDFAEKYHVTHLLPDSPSSASITAATIPFPRVEIPEEGDPKERSQAVKDLKAIWDQYIECCYPPKTYTPTPAFQAVDSKEKLKVFLTAIGRKQDQYLKKFADFDELLAATGNQMKEKGIPVSDRRYIMSWREKYLRGWFYPADLHRSIYRPHEKISRPKIMMKHRKKKMEKQREAMVK